MDRRKFLETTSKGSIIIFGLHNLGLPNAKTNLKATIRQITQGKENHFFGYIGQSLTIPWNGTGNRILALSTSFIDHLPDGNEPAGIVLVKMDQPEGDFYKVEKVDQSLGWNPQQGTMYYWNPDKPASQFFFNDRDPKTGKVFTVLYDIDKGKRIREYKFEDTPFGNSGVCPVGKSFLGINYARMARLRPVTGYKEATDWTEGVAAPENDGIFIVDIESGKKKLLVSFARLESELNKKGFYTGGESLFINHTLWNRAGKIIWFFARAGWHGKAQIRTNVPCTVNSDGTDLFVGHQFIGGHPEWGIGNQIIGSIEKDQVIYNVLQKKITGKIGTPEAFPDPEGDISLSPDGDLFANGFSKENKNYYTIIRLSDGQWVRTDGVNKGEYSGDVRIDPAPCWDRQGNQILVSGITGNSTRQLFIISIN
ncbi:MAG: hypothetical protein MUC93_13315 [Bacteroidales bacterium]|jgi:hypothetical protein|nr:hypothetical protein [Bacteroidales bacterium]